MKPFNRRCILMNKKGIESIYLDKRIEELSNLFMMYSKTGEVDLLIEAMTGVPRGTIGK